jgi:hypothetical protein
MIGLVMNEDPLLQFIIPDQFEQAHYDALFAYLRDDRFLKTAVWRQLYNGIDLLDNAQVITEPTTRTFRQVYDELVDRPFANQYLEELLKTKNVPAESERIAAHFARQIKPVLQDAGLLNRQVSYSLLLYGYCLYWWQSFARGPRQGVQFPVSRPYRHLQNLEMEVRPSQKPAGVQYSSLMHEAMHQPLVKVLRHG